MKEKSYTITKISVVNEKRTTVTVRNNRTGKDYSASARRNPEDAFDVKTGVDLALTRALEKMHADEITSIETNALTLIKKLVGAKTFNKMLKSSTPYGIGICVNDSDLAGLVDIIDDIIIVK